MRRPILLLMAAVLVSAVAVVVVVATDPFGDEPAKQAEAPFTTTPLDQVDTRSLTVARASFCADVDPREAVAALGSEPVEVTGYDNGDEVTLADGLDDVAHEFGCQWQAADQSAARAWVFAPPVDRDRAERLVREAGRTQECESSATPAFGSPSVGLVCATDGGGTASYRGLFGDAWLTCELYLTPANGDVSPADLMDRTGAWCSAVARGAAA